MRDARDTRMLVPESHRVVDWPMVELRALTLLGST